MGPSSDSRDDGAELVSFDASSLASMGPSSDSRDDRFYEREGLIAEPRFNGAQL